jgi:hypothetical protein
MALRKGRKIMLEPVTDPNLISQLEGNQQPQYEPVNDPKLVAQLEGSQPGMMSGMLSNIGHDVTQHGRAALAGLGELGHGLLNAPYNITNYFNPEAAKNVPHQPEYDYRQMTGTEPGLTNSLIEGATHYLPYGILASQITPEGANILQRTLAQGAGGTAYGATQSQNPLSGAITGGLTGAGTEVGLSALKGALSPLTNWAKQYTSKFAIPNLFTGIQNFMKGDKDASNQSAFQAASENYKKMQDDEENKWNVAKGYARIADVTPGIKFDNSKYVNSLGEHIGDLEKKLSQSPSLESKNALYLATHWQNAPHNSFESAMEHNKALNGAYRDSLTAGVTTPPSTVKYAISNLKDTLKDNLKNNGLNETLKPALDEANAITQKKNQLFHETVSPRGESRPSSFLNFAQNKNPNADPSTFVQDYMPKKNEGIQKMQQLGEMMGDPNAAKMVIRKNYFQNTPDTKSFLKTYGKLAPEQKQYLFDNDERSKISALDTALKNTPNAFKRGTIAKFFDHAIPGIIGGMGAVGALHGLGHEALTDIAGVGALGAGGKMLGGLTNSLMGTPFMQRRFVNAMNNPQTGNIGTMINPLAQGIGVPQMTGNQQQGS